MKEQQRKPKPEQAMPKISVDFREGLAENSELLAFLQKAIADYALDPLGEFAKNKAELLPLFQKVGVCELHMTQYRPLSQGGTHKDLIVTEVVYDDLLAPLKAATQSDDQADLYTLYNKIGQFAYEEIVHKSRNDKRLIERCRGIIDRRYPDDRINLDSPYNPNEVEFYVSRFFLDYARIDNYAYNDVIRNLAELHEAYPGFPEPGMFNPAIPVFLSHGTGKIRPAVIDTEYFDKRAMFNIHELNELQQARAASVIMGLVRKHIGSRAQRNNSEDKLIQALDHYSTMLSADHDHFRPSFKPASLFIERVQSYSRYDLSKLINNMEHYFDERKAKVSLTFDDVTEFVEEVLQPIFGEYSTAREQRQRQMRTVASGVSQVARAVPGISRGVGENLNKAREVPGSVSGKFFGILRKIEDVQEQWYPAGYLKFFIPAYIANNVLRVIPEVRDWDTLYEQLGPTQGIEKVRGLVEKPTEIWNAVPYLNQVLTPAVGETYTMTQEMWTHTVSQYLDWWIQQSSHDAWRSTITGAAMASVMAMAITSPSARKNMINAFKLYGLTAFHLSILPNVLLASGSVRTRVRGWWKDVLQGVTVIREPDDSFRVIPEGTVVSKPRRVVAHARQAEPVRQAESPRKGRFSRGPVSSKEVPVPVKNKEVENEEEVEEEDQDNADEIKKLLGL